MIRRKYRMRQRAAAVDDTRRRILQATSACHRERGISATSMEDVAHRAGVAVGTVYRHYPTLDNLVDACGAVFMNRFALPKPDHTNELFRGLRSRQQRLARLVETVADSYRGGAIGFVRVREARNDFDAVSKAHHQIEESLDALVTEALRPLRYNPGRRRTLRALLDARVWQSLVDQGLDPEAAEQALRDLVFAV